MNTIGKKEFENDMKSMIKMVSEVINDYMGIETDADLKNIDDYCDDEFICFDAVYEDISIHVSKPNKNPLIIFKTENNNAFVICLDGNFNIQNVVFEKNDIIYANANLKNGVITKDFVCSDIIDLDNCVNTYYDYSKVFYENFSHLVDFENKKKNKLKIN